MVAALDRKLLRDAWRMRGQALTIAAVIACGIASYVTLRSAYSSLLGARDAYYETQRFADVFAHAKRAPEYVASRIDAVPGVALTEVRLVETVMIPVEDLAEPAAGRLIGIAPGGPLLNAIFVRRGRLPEPGRADEAAILETFARAHRLEPGDTLPVVINGVRRNVKVTGIALSPEYVMAVGGSAGQEFAPDDRRFCVLWMDRDAIAPAFDMKGAFDDVTLRLQPGTTRQGVIEAVDSILAPYGGLGAVGRDRQPSAFFVDNELRQLGSYATIAPIIFLAVAGFLVNLVLSRVIHLQRSQIATLKAIGYRGREIGTHYLQLVLLIVALGAAAGTGLGAWLGAGMLRLYQPYFHFPAFDYRLETRVVLVGVLASALAACAGSMAAVWRAVRLPAAEAMQPEAPPTYRRSILERVGLGRLLGGSATMVLRELRRRPLRAALSCLGIAFGVAVIVVGAFSRGALDTIIHIQFEQAQREDMSIAFTEPLDDRVSGSIAHLPGVLWVEEVHAVPVRIRNGHRFRETVVSGLAPGGSLRRVVEWPGRVVEVPPDGLLLGDALASTLGVRAGDEVLLEVLEGERQTRAVRVGALSHEMFGLTAYMSLSALHALLGTSAAASSVLLAIDGRFEEAIDAELKRMPRVAAVVRRRDVIRQFREQSAESMITTSIVLTLFGCAIAAAVVYNNARIALSMRSRDLASLRVLGFTRREISAVLLGELAVYVLVAIGPGLALGKGLAVVMMSSVNQELYRIPVLVTQATYGFAAAVTLAAAIASTVVVRRQLDKLDLIAVLKARE
ncbi:MAG TPA: FtsX-like permease family protein [Polyangiaceae bacterium]